MSDTDVVVIDSDDDEQDTTETSRKRDAHVNNSRTNKKSYRQTVVSSSDTDEEEDEEVVIDEQHRRPAKPAMMSSSSSPSPFRVKDHGSWTSSRLPQRSNQSSPTRSRGSGEEKSPSRRTPTRKTTTSSTMAGNAKASASRLAAARLTLDLYHTERKIQRYGVSFVLHGHNDGVTIGRSGVLPPPGLVLREDIEVSNRHAKIYLDTKTETPKLRIKDLGSSNGTSRGPADLASHRPYVLKEGDELAIGNTVITLQRAEIFQTMPSKYNYSPKANAAVRTTSYDYKSSGDGGIRVNKHPIEKNRGIASHDIDDNGDVSTDEDIRDIAARIDRGETLFAGRDSKEQAAASTTAERDKNLPEKRKRTDEDDRINSREDVASISAPVRKDAPHKEAQSEAERELKRIDSQIHELQQRRSLLLQKVEAEKEARRKYSAWKPTRSPQEKSTPNNPSIPASRFSEKAQSSTLSSSRSLWDISGKAAYDSLAASSSSTNVNGRSNKEELGIQGTQSEWSRGEHAMRELTTDVVPLSNRLHENRSKYALTDSDDSSEDSSDNMIRQDENAKRSDTVRENLSNECPSSSLKLFTKYSDKRITKSQSTESELNDNKKSQSSNMDDGSDYANIDILTSKFTQPETSESGKNRISTDASQTKAEEGDHDSVISIGTDSGEENNHAVQSSSSSGSFASAQGDHDTMESPKTKGHSAAAEVSTSRSLHQEFEKEKQLPSSFAALHDKGPPYDDPLRYSSSDLKMIVAEYGLVPRSRNKMVEQLDEIWEYIQSHSSELLSFNEFLSESFNYQDFPDQNDRGISSSSNRNPASLPHVTVAASSTNDNDELARVYNDKKRGRSKTGIDGYKVKLLNRALKKRETIYEKMLAFEPVDIQEVIEVAQEENINCSRKEIIDFLKDQGVTAAHKWPRKR